MEPTAEKDGREIEREKKIEGKWQFEYYSLGRETCPSTQHPSVASPN